MLCFYTLHISLHAPCLLMPQNTPARNLKQSCNQVCEPLSVGSGGAPGPAHAPLSACQIEDRPPRRAPPHSLLRSRRPQPSPAHAEAASFARKLLILCPCSVHPRSQERPVLAASVPYKFNFLSANSDVLLEPRACSS